MLNYIGYRLMVAMAPFLPGPTGEHLNIPSIQVSLSVEGRRIPGMERLQACVQLAEKVFGAALTVMLRHATPSPSATRTPRANCFGLAKSATDAMAHFVKQVRLLTAHLVPYRARTSLLTPKLRPVVKGGPGTRRCRVCRRRHLSLGVPREQPGEHEPGQLLRRRARAERTQPARKLLHMKTTAQRRYWSVLQRVHRNGSATAAHGGAWNEGLISLHGISSFDLRVQV
ncbi:hypothetical protein MRX96_053905 [Rhipicephalus microplus]